MAARTKEKTGLSPSQGMDIPHGKRTPKSSITESPEKESSLLGERPKPNYLKPTLSSRPDPCKFGKKQASESQAPKRLVRKSSFDKPQSSTSQPQKIQGSSSFREKPLRNSSSAPKAATFLRSISEKVTTASKTISERATKAVRNGKTQPSTKPKVIKREPSFTRKRETKSSSPVTSASQESEKPPSICDEQEIKELENVEVEGNNVDEIDQPKMPLSQDEVTAESVEIEPGTSENENVEALDSAISAEAYEEDCKTEVEGTKDNVVDEEQQEQNGEQHETSEPPDTSDQYETSEPHETSDQHETIDQNETCDDQKKTIDRDETSDQQEGFQTQHSKENGIVDVEQPKKSKDGDLQSSEEKQDTMDVKEEEPSHGSQEAKEVSHWEEEKEGNDKEREAAEKAEENDPEPGITSPRKNEDSKKKESPAYNDVIEETASKLAEKRKNRVLALAGAFETVISLHESTVQVPKGRE